MNRSYPNPDMVPYATTAPASFPCQLTTQDPGKNIPIHYHSAYMDAEGNGNTDVDSGHFHRIKGGKVQIDPSDGHTHGLTMLPCGPSAPQNMTRYDGRAQLMGPLEGLPWKWIIGGGVLLGILAVVFIRKSDD